MSSHTSISPSLQKQVGETGDKQVSCCPLARVCNVGQHQGGKTGTQLHPQTFPASSLPQKSGEHDL